MSELPTTREKLLDSAFTEFYTHGFQGANISVILKNAGINKGSMYHFFASKKELGLAVIRERISSRIKARYAPLAQAGHPLAALMERFAQAPLELTHGCPLNNMTQEMAPLDGEFKAALQEAYLLFESLVASILEASCAKGEIMPCDFRGVATFLIAIYEGGQMIAKTQSDTERYEALLERAKSLLRPRTPLS